MRGPAITGDTRVAGIARVAQVAGVTRGSAGPRGARGRVGTALRLARGSVLGVTWAFALLGVASTGGPPTWRTVGAVLAAATAFHVAVYVWNDVVDLPLDRTEPRRATSPLVLGTVGARTALCVAWCCAAAAVVLVAATALVRSTSAGVEASGAMVLALALLGAYDVWGKRAAVPPLTDLVQGLGWAALVWSGAAAAGGATALTGWLGAAVVGVVLLVNGVVGAGRDLANDQRHGARTTALWLGARADAEGVHLPASLRAYGVALHVATVGVVLGALVAGGQATPVRVVVVLLGGGAALAALAVALTRPEPASWTAGLAHVLVMVLLPFAAVPRLGGPLAALLVVLAVAPWAGSGWVQGRVAALAAAVRHPRGRVATQPARPPRVRA